MEILILFALFIVGIIAGFIGGMLGLSGGVITVPCLVLLFHFIDFPQGYIVHTAIGTSLAAMVFNGIASTWAHSRVKGVQWSIVLNMFPGIILGCLLGSFVANFLSGILLQIIFGLFLSLLGAYLVLYKRKKKKVHRPEKAVYTWLGLGIGSMASLLGIGGGAFTVPLLISYRYPVKEAVGTSAAVGLCITFLAAIAYLYFGMNKLKYPFSFGYIYLPAFALIGVGAVVFAPLGARIAHRIKGSLLRRIFAGTLIIVGILMIFN